MKMSGGGGRWARCSELALLNVLQTVAGSCNIGCRKEKKKGFTLLFFGPGFVVNLYNFFFPFVI